MVAPTKKWWFVLGREPLLSLAELKALLPGHTGAWLKPNLYRVSGETISADALMKRLGGTIKIAQEIKAELTREALFQTCLAELSKISGKITFGLSFYAELGGLVWSRNDLELLGKNIKKELKSQGRSARFIPNKELTLSSATVLHNSLLTKGIEFLIIPNGKTLTLAKTAALQPFEAFGARDFGRPGFDSVSGMLPPKLALLMLNLANIPPHATLLDPFCGSGTVLTEALIQGFATTAGTDLSDKAVADTKKNIEWTRSTYHVSPGTTNVQISDARELEKILSPKSIDAIVTEPYLGPPLKGSETLVQLQKNCQELCALYLAAFRSFKIILKPKSIVVFVIPRFQAGGDWATISNTLVPEIKKLGFIPEQLLPPALSTEPFVLYHRLSQRLGREIWKFTLLG